MNRSYEPIGSFEMTAPTMRASDPGYDKSAPLSGTISDCLTGRWDAAIVCQDTQVLGVRVALLAVKHTKTVASFALCDELRVEEERVCLAPGWQECQSIIGVDSGQAGLFDDARYKDVHVFDGWPKPAYDWGDVMYNHCCALTLSERMAGVLPCGAVSSSGYGDGAYTAVVHRNQAGMADCAVLLFL